MTVGSTVTSALSSLLWLTTALAGRLTAQTNLTVASDGSAPFKTVQEAIMAVPAGSPAHPVLIHVKPDTIPLTALVPSQTSPSCSPTP